MINIEQKNLDDFDRKKPIVKKTENISTKFGHDQYDDLFEAPTMKVIEESKEYVWIRLFVSNVIEDIVVGDTITMTYVDTNEKIEMIFATYEKKGLYKNADDEIINYTDEVDDKILCMMVDLKTINYSTDIPFIRTLFKASRYFEYQLLRRNDLVFKNNRTNETLDYYDVAF